MNLDKESTRWSLSGEEPSRSAEGKDLGSLDIELEHRGQRYLASRDQTVEASSQNFDEALFAPLVDKARGVARRTVGV